MPEKPDPDPLGQPQEAGRILYGPWHEPTPVPGALLALLAAFAVGLVVGGLAEADPRAQLRRWRAQRAAEEAYQAALSEG